MASRGKLLFLQVEVQLYWSLSSPNEFNELVSVASSSGS